MTSRLPLALTTLSIALMAACSSTPSINAQLTQASSDYHSAEMDPRANRYASTEMRQAQEALSAAQASWQRQDSPEEVNHLAYLARQQVAIAREAMAQRGAEESADSAGATRDAIRLDARTQEARMAQEQALQAQAQAEMARAENQALQERLRELKARPGPRGTLLTLDDVLFNSDQAQLKPAGLRLVDQLTAVLKEHPHWTVTIEGYTDNTGTEAHNLILSSQRAEMEGSLLRDAGIAVDRMSMRGAGESNPVASNQSAEGRAMNRRVEIVLSHNVGPRRGR